MASSLGVSLGKVNYCIRALIEKGFVKANNYRNSANKLSYFYVLTPAGVAAKADMTRRFLNQKMIEYEALRREIERLRVEVGMPEHGADEPGSFTPMPTAESLRGEA